MKYFTRAWHGGDMTDAEAERVPSLYETHLKTILARLPNDARRLATDVSLHDGLLRAAARLDHRFELLFRAGDRITGYFDARVSYGDAVLTASDEQFLVNAAGRPDVEMIYDEFDASGTGWVQRFLFWPYQEANIHFSTLTLTLTPALRRFDTEDV